MPFETIRALVAVSTEEISEQVSTCLSAHGIKDIQMAFTMYQAVSLMHDYDFNMFVVDGRLLVSSNPNKVRVAGVDFVRFIRMCEGPVSEAHVLFLRSDRHPDGMLAANSEFNEAREGGASCVLAQPLTDEKFERYVQPLLENPPAFIRERSYTGPCRRKVDAPVTVDRRKAKP